MALTPEQIESKIRDVCYQTVSPPCRTQIKNHNRRTWKDGSVYVSPEHHFRVPGRERQGALEAGQRKASARRLRRIRLDGKRGGRPWPESFSTSSPAGPSMGMTPLTRKHGVTRQRHCRAHDLPRRRGVRATARPLNLQQNKITPNGMKKRKAPFPWGIGLAKLGPRKYLFDANLAVNLDFIEQQGFDLVEAVDETSQTVVWKAVQRTLERTVILRILKPEAASDPAAVAHFLNIARIVSRIKSESLAAIFDIVSNKGLYYIVMEHVNGPTLEEEVSADGPLPLERILRIAASLIVSLDQLWGASYIVHRNLKSSTIRTSRRGVSKITDFSLAIQASPGVNATAMDEGNIVGTPCFLSPEQAQGSHTLTTQSDMYALGIVLYHLSTGTVPFENEDVVSILAAHVKRQIPPPHHLDPGLSLLSRGCFTA